MSTITTTARPLPPYHTATISWQDIGFDPFSTNIRVQTTTNIAQLAGIAGLADVISQAHVCDLVLENAEYDVAGEDNSSSGDFARVNELLQFEFRSPAECRAREIIQIPAPERITGTPAAAIFSDVAARTVNLSQPDVAAFLTALAAQLASTQYTVTDWVCVNGERVTAARGYRGKANS